MVGLGILMVHPILCKLLKFSPNLSCAQVPVDYPYCSSFKGNITQSENIFGVTKKIGAATVPSKEFTVNTLGKKKKKLMPLKALHR